MVNKDGLDRINATKHEKNVYFIGTKDWKNTERERGEKNVEPFFER